MSDSSDHKHLALDSTFGAVLLGTFVSLMLYGLTLRQAFQYYSLYPQDKVWLKCVVIVTVLLETIHMVLSCHVCYYYLVTSYFEPMALLYGTWSVKLLLLCSVSIILVSQSYFAWRVFLVGPNYRMLVLLAISLIVGGFAFFVAATIKSFLIPTFREFEHLTWLISTGTAMAIGADLLLTTVLIITLHRLRTGIKRTDSILDILILYAISTGLLTSMFDILSFLFTLLYTGNLIYIAFAVIATKLYANTLLVALNCRNTLSGSGGIREASDLGLYGTTIVFGGGMQCVNLSRVTATSESLELGVLHITATSSTFVLDSSEECHS